MSRDCGSFTEIEKRPFSSVPMKRKAFFFTFIARCPHGNSSYASGKVSAYARSFDSMDPPFDLATRLLPLQHHGHADPARRADGDQAVLLAGALQLVADRGNDPRAGGAEWMSKCDRSAGQVDLFRIDVADWLTPSEPLLGDLL